MQPIQCHSNAGNGHPLCNGLHVAIAAGQGHYADDLRTAFEDSHAHARVVQAPLGSKGSALDGEHGGRDHDMCSGWSIDVVTVFPQPHPRQLSFLMFLGGSIAF